MLPVARQRVINKAAQARQFSLSALLGSSNYPTTPLNVAFEDYVVPDVKGASDYDINPQVTKLDNGLTVISQGTPTPGATLALWVNSGSRNETDATAGFSHFKEKIAFGSTQNKTGFQIHRDLNAVGANVITAASREGMLYSAETLKSNAGVVAERLADMATRPVFSQFEIDHARQEYKYANGERLDDVEATASEHVHGAAFAGRGLGRSLFANDAQLDNITAEKLAAFHQQQYQPSRMVLSAVGVDHEQLVAIANENFGELKDTNTVQSEASQYVGGERRVQQESSSSVGIALAWNGADWHSKDLVPACVLQQMMGGGESFSAGGPGKGMYTRLYSNVLNKHHWVHGVSCFDSIYTDSALFGLFGQADVQNGTALAEVLVSEAKQMTVAPDAEELSRAKNQLKGLVLINNEHRSALAEDIGKQQMVYGKYQSSADLVNLVDAVTADDIARVANNLLKSEPSLAVVGDTTNVPGFSDFRAALLSK